MNSTIIVALISFAGTAIGTLGGFVASGKLTAYRLEQLEKKMDAHSSVASRVPVIEEKIKTINRRIAKLEHEKVVDYCSLN
jgi:hypothetical protein